MMVKQLSFLMHNRLELLLSSSVFFLTLLFLPHHAFHADIIEVQWQTKVITSYPESLIKFSILASGVVNQSLMNLEQSGVMLLTALLAVDMRQQYCHLTLHLHISSSLSSSVSENFSSRTTYT